MAKLFWRYGSMGAGKSVNLLSVAHNYDRIKQKTKTYTTSMDNRFGEGVVASRMGISRPAELFTKETVFSMNAVGDGVSCILIDEAQFLKTIQVQQLHKIAAIGDVPVICYGLRTDFMGRAFEGAAALGVWADQMEELKSICQCGKKASFNLRFDGAGERVRVGEQIHIGGDDSYRQSCPVCFYS